MLTSYYLNYINAFLCACSMAVTSTDRAGWVLFCQGAPESSAVGDSGLKGLGRYGHGLKSHLADWESLELKTPGYKANDLSTTPNRLFHQFSRFILILLIASLC